MSTSDKTPPFIRRSDSDPRFRDPFHLAALEAVNRTMPDVLEEVPRHEFERAARETKLVMSTLRPPVRVMRSKRFLMQQYNDNSFIRLSICRTSIADGEFIDGISWDELQRLKREAGFGDHCAVEVYPKDRDIIYDANFRHLWILDKPFGWSTDPKAA